jgi:hypothetical protein
MGPLRDPGRALDQGEHVDRGHLVVAWVGCGEVSDVGCSGFPSFPPGEKMLREHWFPFTQPFRVRVPQRRPMALLPPRVRVAWVFHLVSPGLPVSVDAAVCEFCTGFCSGLLPLLFFLPGFGCIASRFLGAPVESV